MQEMTTGVANRRNQRDETHEFADRLVAIKPRFQNPLRVVSALVFAALVRWLGDKRAV